MGAGVSINCGRSPCLGTIDGLTQFKAALEGGPKAARRETSGVLRFALSGDNNKAAQVPIHLSVLTGALATGQPSRNPSSCFGGSFIRQRPRRGATSHGSILAENGDSGPVAARLLVEFSIGAS